MVDRAIRRDLDAARWAVALARAGIPAPPGFEPVSDPDPEIADGALVETGLAALAVLVSARITVQVTIGADVRGLRTVLGVGDRSGASLTTLRDGGVQASVFAAVALGVELTRAVSDAATLMSPEQLRWRCLDAVSPTPVAGILPLAALTEYRALTGFTGPLGHREAAASVRLTPEQAELAELLQRSTLGVLHALVSGPVEVSGGLGTGVMQTVWFGTEAGWVLAEPDLTASGERMVRLRPVSPADLGTVLAPGIAQLLANQDEHRVVGGLS